MGKEGEMKYKVEVSGMVSRHYGCQSDVWVLGPRGGQWKFRIERTPWGLDISEYKDFGTRSLGRREQKAAAVRAFRVAEEKFPD